MKSLAILYPGCIETEVLGAMNKISRWMPVEIATPEGGDFHGRDGRVFANTRSFAAVKADLVKNRGLYRAVLVPGGNPDGVALNADLREILDRAYFGGSVMGAVCAGPVLLERAGLLRGRRIAHGYGPDQFAHFKTNGIFNNVTLTDEPLVVDGRIITAKPEAHAQFADAMNTAILSARR